jgi:hypothetical protein
MPIETTDNMKLAEAYGPVLTGRALANHLATVVLDNLARGEDVDLDFAGVQAVSPSFADELFGKLGTRVDIEHVHFTNLSPHLESVARMVQEQRRASDTA